MTEEFGNDQPESFTPEEGDSFFGRLMDLFRSPSSLMDKVGRNPQWWAPCFFIFLIMIGFTWLVTPISAPEQLELMRDSKLMQMAPEEAWEQQYQEALDISTSKLAIQALTAGFTTWILIIVFGFILGFFARMSGGQVRFKQALGIISWSAIPVFAVGSLVKLPLILATESVYSVSIGLAALMRGADPSSPLYQLLMTYGDFFTWWGLVLIIIGFQRVFNMDRGPAIASVVLPWALLSAIPLGFSLLFM
jgi:hypothetical protein